MYALRNTVMQSVRKAAVNVMKRTKPRQLAAFVLSTALLANTIPMEAFAARNMNLPPDAIVRDNGTAPDDASGREALIPDDVSGGNTAAGSLTDNGGDTTEGSLTDNGGSTMEGSLTDNNGNTANEPMADNGNTLDGLYPPPLFENSVSGNGFASVSMSDARLMALRAAVAASLHLDVEWPTGYNNGNLTVSSGEMPFTIIPNLPGDLIAKSPRLVVTIPACMEVTDARPSILDEFYAPQNPFSSETVNGNTVLTYNLAPVTTTLYFPIYARITSGYRLKDGASYSIKLAYYDGTTLLGSDEKTFTVQNPSIKGAVKLSSVSLSNSRQTLREDTQTYFVGPCEWGISAPSGHYAYDSLKMTVPLPAEATPGFGSGSSFTELKDGASQSFGTYKVTRSGSSLIFEMLPGNTFLTSGTSFYFRERYGGLYLRFTINDYTKSVSYSSSQTPKIECTVDGRSVVMREHDTASSYLATASFTGLTTWTEVRPSGSFDDIIYLEEDVSDYYTNIYTRSVYAYPPEHVAYKSLKMTVPLPQGAEPGFRRGSSFTPLESGKQYSMGNFYVTYYNDKAYSNADNTVSGTANTLVYEITSGGFLSSQHSAYTFTFDGTDYGLCLHFKLTELKDEVRRSPASPRVEVTLNSTTVMYDHNNIPSEQYPHSYYTSVTFVAPPKDAGVYPDFMENKDDENNNYGWYDTIPLVEGQNVYYTRLYDRMVYSPASPAPFFIPHHPYDRVEMTVLLPDEATPGFGTGENFVPLTDGRTYTIPYGTTKYYGKYGITTISDYDSSFTVTYHAQYPYSNESGTASGTAQALVYGLNSKKSTASFLKSAASKSSFTFTGSKDSESNGLYLRFTDPEPGTYCSAASPRVYSWVAGKQYVAAGYFEPTKFDTRVTFEAPKMDWSLLSVTGSTNATSYGLDSDYVLPDAYQNDKVYYGSITNNTGFILNNVRVDYTFDKCLNVDKLTLALGERGYPANAEVVYRTSQDPQTDQTARLDTSHNILALEQGNTFLSAEITYDTLESSSSSKQILTANLHNYDKVHSILVSRGNINAVPVSASTKLESSDDTTVFSPSSTSFYILDRIKDLTVSEITTTPDEFITKGSTLTVRVAISSIKENPYAKCENLSLCLRMPKGYILTEYTPPAGWKGGGYSITSHTLDTGELMYCLTYTDDKQYDTGYHSFSFRIGPEADTATKQTLNIPAMVYAAAGENKLFQFSDSPSYSKTETELHLDVNGDGDMNDRFYTRSGPYVTVDKAGFIGTDGYLSTDGQFIENTVCEYSFDSGGKYRFIIYNGIESGTSVSNGVFTINLRKRGEKFSYNNESYTSQYDVLLKEAIVPEGGFFENCTILYSTDGKNYLPFDQIEDCASVTSIKVTTARDKILDTAESAYLNLSFSVGFPDNKTAENLETYKSYIDTQIEYEFIYDGKITKPDTPPRRISELIAKPIEFSGTIYHDRNWNLEHDANDGANNKAYSLTLYAGNGTDGTKLQNISTNPGSGAYSFNVQLPGTYTLHVEKDESEYYGAAEHFDENGNYTFTLDTSQKPVTEGLDLGILSGLAAPEFTVLPDKPNGKNGWYVTQPHITLRPIIGFNNIDTMFTCNAGTFRKQTPEIRPVAEGTGSFHYEAYNTVAARDDIRSESAALELKVDTAPPELENCTFDPTVGTSSWDKIGHFLTFGNFFNEAVRVTVTAEDAESGVDILYYTLPGEKEQTAKADDNGNFRFDIPMNTAGTITYYVEDKAGNKSEVTTLKKEDGSELWVLEDKGPVWENFVLTDANGDTGVQGSDGSTWFTGPVNVSARVTDEDSGLALISSQIVYDNAEPVEGQEDLTDDEKLTEYTFSTTVDAEGKTSLQTEAEDNAANVSTAQIDFGIDKTPPTIVLEEKAFVDDIPVATVLVQDTGSGINPHDIHVLLQGEEIDCQITAADGTDYETTPDEGSGYRLTFSLNELMDEDITILVTVKDYTGWSAELPVTRLQRGIVYVAADTGSDDTGNGSLKHPFQTMAKALDSVAAGGMIVLLEEYNGTVYVNLEVTLDLNGQKLQADVAGSTVTVGPLGNLTIKDSNGSMSDSSSQLVNKPTEGEIFGGIPGDPAFKLEEGALHLTDGTIYCGYTGNGSVEILDEARMMYLLTYLSGEGTGEPPSLHYIEENTMDALKQNTFTYDGYAFKGWLYEDQLYNPGQEILMPGRNTTVTADWKPLIVYVAADTGSDMTGKGSRTYPLQTLDTALEMVNPGGTIVLLENYNGTASVNLEVTLDLNGKVLQADTPGSAVTVASQGSLTITDSNGYASAAEGFESDPESEGEVFGGIPGDPAFTIEDGTLCLADGTIYCGYTGNGSVEILDEARMMYLLTYLSGEGTGEPPSLHYIEENTMDALKQNTFTYDGYAFKGWLYEDQLYNPGQEILMPGRNTTVTADWKPLIVYVAADTGSDMTGKGSRTYPLQTLDTALEMVNPGGTIVLLENYNGTASVNLEVTLDLNGKVLQADTPGSAVTVASQGSLTITDSNGYASAAEGFESDPESEGEVFGGIPGDPAFTIEDGTLCLADGTIYCGYTGNGSVEILDEARMMYLLTYLSGEGTGEPPSLHYIEENTWDALRQNTYTRDGFDFHGWLYEDHLYDPGQEILMPDRNMDTLAKWEKVMIQPENVSEDDDPEPAAVRGSLDPVPKTGNGEADHNSTPRTDRMELYIETRKKDDEPDTED